MKKAILLVAGLMTLIVFLPVAIKTLFPEPIRSYTGDRLNESNYKEVSFLNIDQNLILSGLLFTPTGSGPFPTAVIIHGSGTSRRDNIWYLTLVNHLQDNGILVLLPDKRGSENSEGSWKNSSFEDLASDTKAAINFLYEEHQDKINSLGIIGMSQGGHIAPIVAKEQPNLNFIINMAGAALPMHEQFLYEENYNLREIGFLPGISNILSYITTYYHRKVGDNKVFWNAIGNYDPLADWKSVKIPTLVLYGQEDKNVPVMKSKSNLELINNQFIQINLYPGSDHAIQDPEGSGSQIIREEVLTEISSFIKNIK